MNEKDTKKLFSLFCRFRPQELPEVIDDIFGEVAWEEIKNAGIRQKINLLNSRNLASLCLKVVQNDETTTQDIQKWLWYLMFCDVRLHKNVSWDCAVLLDEVEAFPDNFDDLHRGILRAYRSEARNTEIITKLQDNIVWIMLIEKIITKKGIKHGKPFFAAFDVDSKKKYLFYSPKINKEPDHVSLLGKALGYDSYHKINFQGNDIRTMLQMIKRHERPSNEVVSYQPERYFMDGGVIDFTQGRERSKYAESILPPGSTNLRKFTVISTSVWRSSLITTQMTIDVKGRNSSVEDVLRALIAQNLITLPVPEYIRRLPSLDRNIIKIKMDTNQEEEEESESEKSDFSV